ncbi:hypothetical protein ARALYDRAFT_890555 [Arabidopsis lyrata subsp. lyrata]|uniref:KIB1-4 beta-propeller domain-containing protein n=1 Tax=Arabidopsis lyrata subsp. lyrata TaxID=81972 RepID=D7KER6_ARALL|nr:hypothetical protein ARALYDRAFT_890555 [Arabidopsis lyrata subsp. lyrata]
MSRLLSKLVPLIHKSSRSVRSFSSSTTGPCVSIGSIMEPSPDGGNLGQVLLFNIPDFKLVRADKTYPNELYDAQLVGASHGWGFFSNRTDRSLLISDYLNPHASKSQPKMIPLYSEYNPKGYEASTVIVMVFREEDTQAGRKNMRHTDDIGDLCIFISKGEDFCVKASSFPGLHPNSVFLNGRLFATLNMSNGTFGCYEYPQGTPEKVPYSPFWLPPFSP